MLAFCFFWGGVGFGCLGVSVAFGAYGLELAELGD